MKNIKRIQEKIATEPKYDASNRKRRKYTKALDEYIDKTLQNEKIKDKALRSTNKNLPIVKYMKCLKMRGLISVLDRYLIILK